MTQTSAQTRIPLFEATDNEKTYGITYVSAPYRVAGDFRNANHPHVVQVWDNTGRPNPRDGEPVRYGDYSPLDGGDGQYLDPSRNATDSPTTIQLSARSVVIDGRTRNYGPFDDVLEHDSIVTLVYPDGSEQPCMIVSRKSQLADPVLAPVAEEVIASN